MRVGRIMQSQDVEDELFRRFDVTDNNVKKNFRRRKYDIINVLEGKLYSHLPTWLTLP